MACTDRYKKYQVSLPTGVGVMPCLPVENLTDDESIFLAVKLQVMYAHLFELFRKNGHEGHVDNERVTVSDLSWEIELLDDGWLLNQRVKFDDISRLYHYLYYTFIEEVIVSEKMKQFNSSEEPVDFFKRLGFDSYSIDEELGWSGVVVHSDSDRYLYRGQDSMIERGGMWIREPSWLNKSLPLQNVLFGLDKDEAKKSFDVDFRTPLDE